MALFDSLIKPALDTVDHLIGDFHLSPEQSVQAKQAIADAAAKAQQASLDYDVQLNTIAAKSIQTEESAGDRFTLRARPSFMYVVIATIGFNYIALPVAQIFGSQVAPIQLPADLLTLFGVCVTGYVVSRTAEKVAALPGDSQISLLGIKVGNKN
jgi:Holin of 3TMs, for gene-transfer release